MYVGTEGYVGVAALGKPCLDVAEVFGFACALGGETYELTACFDDAYGLLDAACGVHGGAGGHGLYGYGGCASDGELADVYGVGCSSCHDGYGVSSACTCI